MLETPGGVHVASAASPARTPRPPTIHVTPGATEGGVPAAEAAAALAGWALESRDVAASSASGIAAGVEGAPVMHAVRCEYEGVTFAGPDTRKHVAAAVARTAARTPALVNELNGIKGGAHGN